MSGNNRGHGQQAGLPASSPVVQSQTIEIEHSKDLTAVLSSLGIGWSVGRPPNGIAGTIRVQLDHEGDFVLEQIIGRLSDLRWRYTPGRTLQLRMNFEDMGGDDDSH
jgi:hypothetical protein